MLRQAAGWLLVGAGAACSPAVPAPAGPEPVPPSARFTSSGLELRFPRNACGPCRLAGDSVSNQFPGPGWEVMIHSDTAWLAGVLQVLPDRTQHLPVADSLPALLRAATPLDCTLSSHVMACGRALQALTLVTPTAVVVRISERRWRRRLRADRPDSLNLAFRVHNTETLWHRRIAIDYADR